MKSQVPVAIVIAGITVAGAVFYEPKMNQISVADEIAVGLINEEEVILTEGITLPVTWGDLGQRLVDAGAIDAEKLKALYQERGELTSQYEKLLSGSNEGKLIITPYNANHLLNMFWALGLANKNEILDSGEMVNKEYGGAGGFASTGGWTMGKGEPMEHYSKHSLINLTLEQQILVDKVSRGIYRPCCNNSTHFPDCNHGMAMLGFLELAASQGASEEELFEAALAVNSYWFPDTYLKIAEYMKSKGVEWKDVAPAEILGMNFSSSSGYKKVLSQLDNPVQRGGAGCSV